MPYSNVFSSKKPSKCLCGMLGSPSTHVLEVLAASLSDML